MRMYTYVPYDISAKYDGFPCFSSVFMPACIYLSRSLDQAKGGGWSHAGWTSTTSEKIRREATHERVVVLVDLTLRVMDGWW